MREVGSDCSVLALEADALREAAITRVLSVMTKDPHKKNGFTMHSNIAREYIMMEDIATFQSHPWYQTTSAIIDSALHAGERILIHWYPIPLKYFLTCQVAWEFLDPRPWWQHTSPSVTD
jgi:hypothetical protein